MVVSDAPGREAVESQALGWPDRARALTITDADSYTVAAAFLRGIKGLRAEADSIFDPPIKAALEAHRAAIAAKRKVEVPLAEAETIIKGAMVAWDDAQERIRIAQQREAEAADRRRQEDERIALAAHLEREGKATGDVALVAEAEAIIEQPIIPVVAPVPSARPAVSGQHFTVTWSARVTSLIDLVRFVAAHPSHIGLISASLPALNAQARSLKSALAIPGVQAVPSKTVSSRR